MKGSIRNIFPGGNTSEGFYSYYDNLLEKGKERIFVLKGGPGVGKSMLMKEIGKRMVNLGYDLEYHYCSSDSDSLDGIAILEAGIVMVDGTNPHIIDPKYPGGRDEIINLGENWDVDALQLKRKQIMASTQEVSRLFASAYRYLRAAKAIAENIEKMNTESMNFAAVNKIGLGLVRTIFADTYSSESEGISGAERHLFSCAYTPKGFIDLTDSILQEASFVYYLEGMEGTGKSSLMQRIAQYALAKGLDVEIFHTPLRPQKIGAIYIKALGRAITTSGLFKNQHHEKIDLNQYLDKTQQAVYQEALQSDSEILEMLINRAIMHIRKAKAEHDVLEQYYIPHMNFKIADEKREEIFSRILNLSEKSVKAASSLKYN